MEKIKQIISSIRANKGINEDFTLTEDTSLRDDLGFDSFDLAECTVKLDAEYGIDIFETGLVDNIKDVKDKLNLK